MSDTGQWYHFLHVAKTLLIMEYKIYNLKI